MDTIDKKIIELIQFDASLTAREIAEKVGLTTAPCWRRIQRLEAEGIIAANLLLSAVRFLKPPPPNFLAFVAISSLFVINIPPS